MIEFHYSFFKIKKLSFESYWHMGRLTRVERANDGATNRCVNHFTTTAMCLNIITKRGLLVKEKFIKCFYDV